MRTIIILAFGLIFANTIQAQVGSSISSDGTPPNTNAMLDVQSPSTGDGKGMLIPRVTQAQRTTASASLAGGLLDNSGNLRGGPAQGLIVYQADGVQGLYFNTNLTAAPAWVYLGVFTESDPLWASASNAVVANISTRLASNVWVSANSTTNYLARTGGTMSGTLNMGAQIITNVAHIDFYGNYASVGREANGYNSGAALGYQADGYLYGAALGNQAKGSSSGAAVGDSANGYLYGAALGSLANGYSDGAALGYQANGTNSGAVVGRSANGSGYGAALGRGANGANSGAALGWAANGYNSGAALGALANGYDYGVAMGRSANGAQTNVAIGVRTDAQGGTQRIAIGNNVTNQLDNTAAIRGHLYLDGGTGMWYRATFGEGTWTAKAFEIDHPLDPENKILRHFCLEGPQVWNVYAGNAQLVNGQAVVQLPDYYSALNLVGSEIYNLTPISQDVNANAVVKQKVSGNTFVIAGNVDMEVSWTIKVLRNDPGCREDLRRRPVEQMKSELQ